MDVPLCTVCGTDAPEGALFCRKCGRTLPQAGMPGAPPTVAAYVPATVVVPRADPVPSPVVSGPKNPPPGAPANVRYCPRCNNLISPYAVYCPACRTAVAPAAAGVAGVEPPR